MKKTFFLFFAVALASIFAACSEIGDTLDIQADVSQEVGISRSIQEAEAIALDAYTAFHAEDEVTSRSTPALRCEVITGRNSRSTNPDTLLYIVNYGEEEGFAVIGGPCNSTPLYAFVEEGNFSDPEVVKVEGFQLFMENAVQDAASANSEHGGPILRDSLNLEDGYKIINEWIYARSGGRILPLKWGQGVGNNGEFEGMYCPNKIAGCVMTAALLTLAYYQEPAQMEFTFPERDCEMALFDWTDMCKHIVCHNKEFPVKDIYGNDIVVIKKCVANDASHKNLGRITRQLGYEINATYYSSGTGAFTSKMVPLLSSKYIPRCSYYTLNWIDAPDDLNCLIEGLDEGISVVRGSSQSGGHAWIADGYKVVECRKNTYSKGQGNGSQDDSEWELVSSELVSESYFIHYNWGWNGVCNGFFAPNVFRCNSAHDFDLGEGGLREDIDFNNGVTYYIFSR